MLAPINKVPPEILTIIPDFWNTHERDGGIIALTYVCRALREVFVLQSSLWTHFDCVDEEKTRVFFERSKSSPISLSLVGCGGMSSYGPLFRIVPRATGRLKSLYVEGASEDMQAIASRLSHPALFLSIFRYVAVEAFHIITSHQHPLFSMEISLCYACCVWSPFVPSCLGGTWSASPRSRCLTPCRGRFSSNNFLIFSKALLISKESNSAP